jgi:hypothetical protein
MICMSMPLPSDYVAGSSKNYLANSLESTYWHGLTRFRGRDILAIVAQIRSFPPQINYII